MDKVRTERFELVQTVFTYRLCAAAQPQQPQGAQQYRLVQVGWHTMTVAYQTFPIETMHRDNLAAFSHYMCTKCNADSVRLVFISDAAHAYVCEPTEEGLLHVLDVCTESQIAERQRTGHVERFDEPPPSMTCPFYSLMYDYVTAPSQTSSVHVGVAVVPGGRQLMPGVWSEASMREWLRVWTETTLLVCRTNCRLVLRETGERVRIIPVLSHPGDTQHHKVLDATRLTLTVPPTRPPAVPNSKRPCLHGPGIACWSLAR